MVLQLTQGFRFAHRSLTVAFRITPAPRLRDGCILVSRREEREFLASGRRDRKHFLTAPCFW